MADIFRSRIRASLADVNLQSALDDNAARRIRVRKEAYASLSDPQELRQAAHNLRGEVIDHLEHYLQKFITKASQNGIIVHEADNAEQAIQLVLEIASQHTAKLIAKSKTMVSEEIGLNHALEQQGLQVIETDLGEYIVQLRGEPPSHIITPAVHLTRQDVGRLFQEKLGMPYTDDISVMTNVARQTLRQVFLDADVGISGVNFGVAETGTLCLVTNEGNGRMVTTVPDVHIALMGIERLVPTMHDLALMLSLLPRSATGQKLSVYTSLLNSPKRQADPDGPRERHVILVDNGRREVQASGLREILLCIRCGACLNVCPVFREIGGHAYVNLAGKSSPYPGPIGSVISPALFGQLEYGHLARASSLCGACREACPVDIDLPKLLLRVRAGVQVGPSQAETRPNAPATLAVGLKLYTLLASSPWRFATAQRLAGFITSLMTRFFGGDHWLRMPQWSGWGYSKDFPLPDTTSFRARFLKHNLNAASQSKKEAPESPVNIGRSDTRQSNLIQPIEGKEAFAQELTALGGNFIDCAMDEVSNKVHELLRERRIDKLLTWGADFLPEGLPDQLAKVGIHLSQPTRETQAIDSKVRAGLTGAFAGIADTGSLVLLAGPGQPLSASLLPEIHIAILREQDIVNNLGQVLASEEVKNAPAAVIVSGPSRTADIEMALTIGVHGPGELHVICIHAG